MSFSKISSRSQELLLEIKENEYSDQVFLNYISLCDSLNVFVPDFEDGKEWFNTYSPLSFATNLVGKIVILDFFTYCCINCMHVLPDLHYLEQHYPAETGIAVIGVHSAKFKNEKLSSNINNAILRYGITHAVVNDDDAILWSKMEIQCWPTFVVVSPEGKCLLFLVGEGHRDTLMAFVKAAVCYYKEKGFLNSHSLPIKPLGITQNSNLRFPGKICQAGNDLAVSDTGNNRILIITKDGIIKKTIGSLKRGWKDSSSRDALFNAPQGVSFWDGCLFVADTENHAVRKIDLSKDLVSTIAGTGVQGNDKEGGRSGLEQAISSPWDVIVGPSPGKSSNMSSTVLYIAMAGTHQIWALFLEDGSWLKSSAHKRGTCIRFAGSGNEENRNNSYPHKASFAQPSGLTIAELNDKKYIYVADSESSSVRSVEIASGAVKACIGGERDPMNLFAYGDQDGKGAEAKLQHPLAVAWNSHDGRIYVADSYNHKIKAIDPLNLTCKTLAGTGAPGFKDGDLCQSQFNEPGGVEISKNGKELLVADTNNHCIRVIDLEKRTVKKLEILFADVLDAVPISLDDQSKHKKTNTKKRLTSKNADIKDLVPLTANLDEPMSLLISVQLPDGCHYTEDVESLFMIILENRDDDEVTELMTGKVDVNGKIEGTLDIPRENRSSLNLQIDILVYFCSSDGVCLMKSCVLKQQVKHDAAFSDSNSINYEYMFSL